MRKSGGTPKLFRIGLIGILASLLLVYVVFSKGNVPILHGYQIQGRFSSSNQLKKGSPVRIAGVTVGKVVGVSNGPGTTQLVKMEIGKEGRPIHQDATLRIRPRVFLEGGFYVELRPGSASAPQLRSGNTIPLAQTSIPVQFHQILGSFNRPARESFKRILDELAVALDKGGAEAFGQAGRPLGDAFKSLAVTGEAARGSAPHDVSQLVRSSSRVTAALAAHDARLADLVTSLNRTTGALASEDDALSATVRELDGVLRDAPGALTALDRAMPPLARFTGLLRPSLRIAPPILAHTNDLVAQLNALVQPSRLPLLVSRLDPAVRALPPLIRQLTDLFPLVSPVARCVRDHVVPVLDSKLDDGALSSGRPVWQDLAHTFVGLASASQDFDANGPGVRYLASLGDQTVSLGGSGLTPQLFGNAAEPIIGVRPRWFGEGASPSPFRPDQPCSKQAPPNLNARTSAPAAAQAHRRATRSPVSGAELLRLLGKVTPSSAARSSDGR